MFFDSLDGDTHGHISSSSSLDVAKPRSLLSVTTLRGSVHLDMASALHLLHDTEERLVPDEGDMSSNKALNFHLGLSLIILNSLNVKNKYYNT